MAIEGLPGLPRSGDLRAMRNPAFPLIAASSLILSGCVSGGAVPPRSGDVRQPPVVVAAPRPMPGDLVVGRTAGALISLFGPPALDVWEGSARKLQFTGERCVLDAYLYPQRAGREAVATYADARLPDGRDTDRAACAESLRRH